MSRVHLSEPEQCLLDGPLPRDALLDPVAGDCKVCVGIAGLPCVTCQANFAFHRGALMSKCDRASVNEKKHV
jgi:hypothetical protein